MFIYLSRFVTQALELLAASPAGQEMISSVRPKASVLQEISNTRASLGALTGSEIDTSEFRDIILTAHTR